jgi:flagellar motor component MotA
MWKAMNTGAAKAMGTGAAIGGAFGAMTTMDPMMHGTWHEFTDPSRIATGIPGAITGTVLGAAAGYGLYKADKALGAKLDARDAARED